MAGMMRIDPDRMATAASRLDALGQEIQEIRGRTNTVMAELRECYEGASARAFEEYIVSSALPHLESTAEMCYQTARGIEHTLTQFLDADRTLSGVFAG